MEAGWLSVPIGHFLGDDMSVAVPALGLMAYVMRDGLEGDEPLKAGRVYIEGLECRESRVDSIYSEANNVLYVRAECRGLAPAGTITIKSVSGHELFKLPFSFAVEKPDGFEVMFRIGVLED
ncbi:MAG TPA: hypothetical protein EYP33_08225 [Pyrodictium sp.]|nr:hypothetical protein [Pyrodictium sp.]